MLEICSIAKYLWSEKITQTYTHVHTQCNRNQERVTTCNCNYLIRVCYVDPDFKPKVAFAVDSMQMITLANSKVAAEGYHVCGPYILLLSILSVPV